MLNHHNFLIELADETVQGLITGGIMQYSIKNTEIRDNSELRLMREKLNHLFPEKLSILSMEDLSYGFVLWIYACMISTAAFLFELTWENYSAESFDYCFEKSIAFVIFICRQIVKFIFKVYEKVRLKI